MIDKVVRQRAKRGPFGMDNSELFGDQHKQETIDKNDRIQRLVDGKGNSRLDGPSGRESSKKGLLVAGIAKRNNSVCGRTRSSLFPKSSKDMHSTQEQSLDDANASVPSLQSLTFEQWCKSKEMVQRLKDKLIEDAKFELLAEVRQQQLNNTRQSKTEEYFSKPFSYIFAVEEWCHAKDREIRMKRKQSK